MAHNNEDIITLCDRITTFCIRLNERLDAADLRVAEFQASRQPEHEMPLQTSDRYIGEIRPPPLPDPDPSYNLVAPNQLDGQQHSYNQPLQHYQQPLQPSYQPPPLYQPDPEPASPYGHPQFINAGFATYEPPTPVRYQMPHNQPSYMGQFQQPSMPVAYQLHHEMPYNQPEWQSPFQPPPPVQPQRATCWDPPGQQQWQLDPAPPYEAPTPSYRLPTGDYRVHREYQAYDQQQYEEWQDCYNQTQTEIPAAYTPSWGPESTSSIFAPVQSVAVTEFESEEGICSFVYGSKHRRREIGARSDSSKILDAQIESCDDAKDGDCVSDRGIVEEVQDDEPESAPSIDSMFDTEAMEYRDRVVATSDTGDVSSPAIGLQSDTHEIGEIRDGSPDISWDDEHDVRIVKGVLGYIMEHDVLVKPLDDKNNDLNIVNEILSEKWRGQIENTSSYTKAIHTKLNDLHIEGIQELEAVTPEMVGLIETASVPILAVDVDGMVNGWNTKIADLIGLPVDKAIGQHLLSILEDSSADKADKVSSMLKLALKGDEERIVHFGITTHEERRESGPVSLVVNACASKDVKENVVGVCFIAQDFTAQRSMLDKFTGIEGEHKAIVQNPNPLIPPIFGTVEFGWCFEWNATVTTVHEWARNDVIDMMLMGEIFGTNTACCRLEYQEACVNLGIVLNKAVTGQDNEKIPFVFFSRTGKYVDCLLCVSKKLDAEGAVTGVFCFLQLASQELQQVFHVQRPPERSCFPPSVLVGNEETTTTTEAGAGSWLVEEHLKENVEQQWLSITFSNAIFHGNGLVATVDSFNLGHVSLFEAAAIFLPIGMIVILASWIENSGDPSESKDLLTLFKGYWSTKQRSLAFDPGGFLDAHRCFVVCFVGSTFTRWISTVGELIRSIFPNYLVALFSRDLHIFSLY